jgi:hypothetical protein
MPFVVPSCHQSINQCQKYKRKNSQAFRARIIPISFSSNISYALIQLDLPHALHKILIVVAQCPEQTESTTILQGDNAPYSILLQDLNHVVRPRFYIFGKAQIGYGN